MPQRRPRQRGSFGGHFDELVVQFPAEHKRNPADRAKERSPELQERIDIHRMLFDHAWRIDAEPKGTD